MVVVVGLCGSQCFRYRRQFFFFLFYLVCVHVGGGGGRKRSHDMAYMWKSEGNFSLGVISPGFCFSWGSGDRQVFGLAWQTLSPAGLLCQLGEGTFYPKCLLSGWQEQLTANLLFSLHFNFLFDQKITSLH